MEVDELDLNLGLLACPALCLSDLRAPVCVCLCVYVCVCVWMWMCMLVCVYVGWATSGHQEQILGESLVGAKEGQ